MFRLSRQKIWIREQGRLAFFAIACGISPTFAVPMVRLRPLRFTLTGFASGRSPRSQQLKKKGTFLIS
jgi:hypothetical protein